MGDSGTYNCSVASERLHGEAVCAIGTEALEIKSEKGAQRLDYADLHDMRLLDYHVVLDTAHGKVGLSALGFQTEDFFEKL